MALSEDKNNDDRIKEILKLAKSLHNKARTIRRHSRFVQMLALGPSRQAANHPALTNTQYAAVLHLIANKLEDICNKSV